MAIRPESQKERDRAFEHGIGVDCPLCGSGVTMLRKVTLCLEYHYHTLATARFEWYCCWCEHDWATTTAAPRELFTSNADVVKIIPAETMIGEADDLPF